MPRDNKNFGEALQALKNGHKVKRSIWGGYWQLKKVEPIMYPMIMATCKDGHIAPAVPYQEDMLAEDWMIID